MRIRDRVARFLSRNYAIQNKTGALEFLSARRANINQRGDLLFYSGFRLIAAYTAGTWVRFVEGLTFADIQKVQRKDNYADNYSTAVDRNKR